MQGTIFPAHLSTGAGSMFVTEGSARHITDCCAFSVNAGRIMDASQNTWDALHRVQNKAAILLAHPTLGQSKHSLGRHHQTCHIK